MTSADRPIITLIKYLYLHGRKSPWRDAVLAEVYNHRLMEAAEPIGVRRHMLDRGAHDQYEFDRACAGWRQEATRLNRLEREAAEAADAAKRPRKG